MEALAMLKAKLLADGVRLSPSISEREVNKPFYSIVAQGVELKLHNGLTANAQINQHSDIVLRKIEHRTEISLDGIRYPVKVLSPASTLSELIPGTEIPVSDYCFIATDRINIWAVENCAMVVGNTACRFCDVAVEEIPYRLQRIEYIKKAADLLIADQALPVRHIQVSGGTPLPKDWGHFVTVCETAIKTELPVSVMITPLAPLYVLEQLLDLGIEELALNVEFHSQEIRQKFIPGKQNADWDRLEKIAEMWPEKSVRSALIVGIEPEKETIAGVHKMVERGIVPMLSPFRPAPGTPLARFSAPTADQLYSTFMRSYEVAVKYDCFIGPTCTACQHNVMSIPSAQ